ncbi:MAG: 3-hydroxyacyl-CoA dehydrogenase family protein [Bacillota bacterium]
MEQECRKIVVVGAGTMGHGIAQAFAQGGLKVSLVDTSSQTLERALRLIKSSLNTMIEEGLLEHTEEEAVLERISFTTSLEEGARDADIAIEAVFEDAELKKEVFARLDACCPSKTLLASNTSFLNVFDFVETSRPEKVLIAHWYAPAQLVPLVDVVGGPKTEEKNLKLVVRLLKKIGKRPVLMKKFISGYAVNRLQYAMHREIMYLLDNDYVTPEQLDEAARVGLAFRMMVVGVVARYDFGGIFLGTGKPAGYEEVPPDYKPKKMQELVDRGYLGVKSGRGFYNYGGKSEEEVYRERDVQLIEMLKVLKKMEAKKPPDSSW